MDVLIDFFKEIKIISFWLRIFRWNKIQRLSYDASNNLPDDILKNMIEFEKTEKLNTPTERRNK